MNNLSFEWDEQKAWENENKHGVSFEEAQTVFTDANARLIYDPDHSQSEDRYILLGMSAVSKLLLVCHVYRDSDAVIRIISARQATRREQQQYRWFQP